MRACVDLLALPGKILQLLRGLLVIVT